LRLPKATFDAPLKRIAILVLDVAHSVVVNVQRIIVLKGLIFKFIIRSDEAARTFNG
jgi:hypothetical protein